MLTAEQLLTTTRSVRKRLDFDRPVSRADISRCIELALQAPNGSNLQTWHWLVVDDPTTIKAIQEIYVNAMDDYIAMLGDAVGENYVGAGMPRAEEITESVMYLRDHFHRLPAVVFPLINARPDRAPNLFMQASLWGSVLQAAWSFMLALRMHDMGSAWTTAHLLREQAMADLLGIDTRQWCQTVMLPVAYTKGTDFKPAWRKPVAEVTSWNHFGEAG